MSIIVSDTSPIRALEHLGLLRLIERYYGQVFIPPTVADELRNSRAGLKSIDVAQFPMIQVVAPKLLRPLSLPGELDPGESEAITLALELNADYLLIDEAAGREVATKMGLSIVGTLGILIRGKEAGDLGAVKPLLESLEQELRFFISPGLRRVVLAMTNEQ